MTSEKPIGNVDQVMQEFGTIFRTHEFREALERMEQLKDEEIRSIKHFYENERIATNLYVKENIELKAENEKLKEEKEKLIEEWNNACDMMEMVSKDVQWDKGYNKGKQEALADVLEVVHKEMKKAYSFAEPFDKKNKKKVAQRDIGNGLCIAMELIQKLKEVK